MLFHAHSSAGSAPLIVACESLSLLSPALLSVAAGVAVEDEEEEEEEDGASCHAGMLGLAGGWKKLGVVLGLFVVPVPCAEAAELAAVLSFRPECQEEEPRPSALALTELGKGEEEEEGAAAFVFEEPPAAPLPLEAAPREMSSDLSDLSSACTSDSEADCASRCLSNICAW